jgi:hypothetical protein
MTYYPSLALVMGLKESIFLCQLIYWTPRGRHEKGDGWIYKSADEMKEETGLTYKEQLRLRKSLLKQDLLEENYDRETHQLFFRVKPEALDSLGGHMTNGHMPKGKVADDQKEGGTLPTVISNKEHRLLKDYTEEPSPVGGKVSKEETKTPDPRHNIVRERFKALWLAHARMTAPPGSPAPETAPWNGRDAGILSKLLTDNPSWTSKFLTYCLESYYFSEAINGGDPFHLIVPKLTRYSGGPLDRFNRPKPRARDPEDAPDGLAEARRQRAAGRPSSAQGEGS